MELLLRHWELICTSLARSRIITHGTLARGHRCLYRKWGWICKPHTLRNTFQNLLSQQKWGVYLWVCEKLSTSTGVTVQKKSLSQCALFLIKNPPLQIPVMAPDTVCLLGGQMILPHDNFHAAVLDVCVCFFFHHSRGVNGFATPHPKEWNNTMVQKTPKKTIKKEKVFSLFSLQDSAVRAVSSAGSEGRSSGHNSLAGGGSDVWMWKTSAPLPCKAQC